MIMAKKQPIKLSEARILIYLDNVKAQFKYVGSIASKLHIDYGYILQILKDMHEKGWIRKEHQGLKSYYFNTKLAPIKAAKELKS